MTHEEFLSGFESDCSEPLKASKSIIQALKDVSVLAFPNILIFVLTNINDMTSLIFISQMGNETYISVVGVSTLIVGMFGLQPLFAIAISLDTLVAQNFGKGDYRMCGLYLNKAAVLLYISCIPSLVCIFCTEYLLLAFGFEANVAALVSAYVSRMCIFIVSSVTFYLLNRFLNAQQIAYPQMVIIGVTSLLHPLWCYLFIFTANLGCFGLNWAYSVTGLLNLFALIGYMYWSRCSEKSLVMPSSDIFYDWGEFLKIACAGTAMATLEWWGYYVLMLFAGYLNPIGLATNQVITSVDIIFYMVPTGVGSALTALVGNSLGKRKVKEAKMYSLVSTLLSVGIVVALIIIVLIFRRPVAEFYTPNKEIQELYVKAILVALVSFFVDCFQGVLSRIFVAQGKQIYATMTNLVVYYLILIPLGYLCVAKFKMGVYGLWVAGACGFSVSLFIFLAILYFQDWDALAKEAYQRSETINTIETSYTDTELVEKVQKEINALHNINGYKLSICQALYTFVYISQAMSFSTHCACTEVSSLH
eukprot:TRINITY_DN120884_c1_g1_i1.p1 TRINITY_DN120884_c1_g1~~TRINITY_DN120884_c1_g1_i1.p1  ORF type:complete len:562 (-),score=13.56 TRINITY_DN120884_c1_g1_i1:1491-3089(-)